MITALALAVQGFRLYAYSFDRLTQSGRTLLDRAVAAGEIRSDISAKSLRARRHVLHARPTRLAIDCPATVGCVRRRPFASKAMPRQSTSRRNASRQSSVSGIGSDSLNPGGSSCRLELPRKTDQDSRYRAAASYPRLVSRFHEASVGVRLVSKGR